jgi:hypothetical protein
MVQTIVAHIKELHLEPPPQWNINRDGSPALASDVQALIG